MTTEEENCLIAERLLGWVQSSIKGYWYPSSEHVGTRKTPTFTDWHSAGLILEALARESARHPRSFPLAAAVGFDPGKGDWSAGAGSKSAEAATGPLAVRAAALAYLRDGTVVKLPEEQDDTL